MSAPLLCSAPLYVAVQGEDSRALTTPSLSAFHSMSPPASLTFCANSSPSPTPPRLAAGISPFGPKKRAKFFCTAGNIPGVERHLVGATSPDRTRGKSSSPPTKFAPAPRAAWADDESGSANTRITSGALRQSSGSETRPRRGREDFE